MAYVLAVNSTNVVELTRLQDTTTKTLPTTAVVTFTLKDSTGTNVPGATAVPMGYEPATITAPAAYRCRISATVPLVAGAKYTGYITAVAGNRVREFPLKIDVIDPLAP